MNRLPADSSHDMSNLIFSNNQEKYNNICRLLRKVSTEKAKQDAARQKLKEEESERVR